ncbi:hypothetical protein [Mycetocola sp. JXN-3]|uniref:hypothetical protein n=1 Tax=Mycetocola sp. JXN-3 TaxID=2116510 RepID=UPI00165D07F0|nr:hypothetical protein [Mycetocola sp. JXN-3]
MNATNRIVNRALLLVTGLALAIVGAFLVLASGKLPRWADGLLDTVAGWLGTLGDWLGSFWFEFPGGVALSGAAVLLIAKLVILLVLLIIFLSTRGGGKTATVLRIEGGQGDTELDANLVENLIAARLRESTDVLSAGTGVYRVRRAPAIRLSITLRRGARVPRVLDEVERAVRDWDALAGTTIPVILHLQGRGWLDRWRSATRVR